MTGRGIAVRKRADIRARAEAAQEVRDHALYALSYGDDGHRRFWEPADASARDVPTLEAALDAAEAKVAQVEALRDELMLDGGVCVAGAVGLRLDSLLRLPGQGPDAAVTADPAITVAAAIAHDLTDNAEVAEAIHEGRAPDVTDLAAHLLAVLAEEGWAVVKLPEPDMSDEKFGQVWSNDPVVGTVQACLDGTCELRGDYEYTHLPAELREAAAALLAAARAAEGVG